MANKPDILAHQDPEERAPPTPGPRDGAAYSSVSFLLSSMKAMDSDLRRLVTS